MSFSARTVSAADKTVEAKSGETIYNLRDGSIIATDTDGKKDVTYDRLTVKVGTKNAYKYNGPDHGVAFKDGNSLEIAVDGPSKISLGGCQYSNNGTITASSDRWFIYRNKGCQNCYVLSSGWYNYRFCIYR